MAASTAHILSQPLKLGPLTLKNRVFMAPMTRNRAVPTNVANDLMAEYYQQRAGAGLIISEGTLITQQGTEWANAPGIWNEAQVEGWKKTTDAIHASGSVIFAQLWHVGRVSHPDMPEHKESGRPVYGPSAIAAAGGKFRLLPGEPGYVTPTAIENPAEFVQLFKDAAVRAKQAGFDGVEIHGAGGYLVQQFLDTSANQRADKWGGSIENRARFGLEVVKAVAEVWGADRVGIKLAPTGGINDIGMPLQETIDTFSYFISELTKLNIAFISLTRYSQMLDPTGRATKHDVIPTYAPLFAGTKTKLFANAGYTPEEAAEAIQTSNVEGVFFGLPYIHQPDLAERIRDEKAVGGFPDFTTMFYNGVDGNYRRGYSDYPRAT